MRIFGIDPGSVRTGFGCVESDGSRHRLVAAAPSPRRPASPFPERLHRHPHRARRRMLAELPARLPSPSKSLFHAVNARSALQLGHARGVALLAADAGRPAGRRISAGRSQARGRRLRARREARRCSTWSRLLLGLDDAARAVRRVGRARRGHLPRARHAARQRAPSIAAARAADAAARRAPPRSWRDYKALDAAATVR